MQCLLWNAQSLQNKVDYFLQILEDNDLDFAFITETWMPTKSNLTSGLLKESGYNMFHSCRSDKVGGGVAIVAKTTFVPKNAKTFPAKTFEVFIQNFKLLKESKPVTLVIFYRLQNANKADFINEFYDFIEFLTTNYSHFLICGDFNIHVNTNDKFASDFNEILDSFSLNQAIHEPTHKLGNTLDLIVHDPTVLNISNLTVEKPNKSDHSCIYFNLHCNFQNNIKKQITFRNIKNVNIESFKTQIESISEQFVSSCSDESFEQLFIRFSQMYGEVVESHAPVVTKSVYVNTQPGWIDQEFKSARSLRRKMFKKWKRSKSDIDRENFETKRREVNELSFQKRREYYSKCISESSNSQKELFKFCNSLLDTNQSKHLPDCQDFDQLANQFNDYFVQKITKLRNNMSSVNVENVDVNKLRFGVDGPACAQSTLSSFSPVTADKLKKLILSRKIKTTSNDTIPAKLLAACLDEVLPALVILVNKSLLTGNVNGLKNSVINPLLKKWNLDPDTLSNYRPIANILYLSKLIEGAVSLELNNHMDLNALHISNQSGYKANHSCETLLLGLNTDILKCFDGGKCVILILLDLSAAFDTVDHDRLISILFNEIGLRGTALEWFKSYLFNRQQAVNINGTMSNFVNTSYGVPQGSVLGPTLFNIYVRSLISLLRKAGFVAHGYADDHQVLKAFSVEFQYEAIRSSVPELLDIIAYWMKASFLKLNSSKTQVIIFSPNNLSSQVHIDQIKLSDGCIIPISTWVSNLGVTFDCSLSFSLHINSICSQSYRLLRNLASIRKFISTGDLRLLVQSIIVSRIDNCNSLLYGVLARNINKLQKLQNACARVIYGKRRRDHVTPLLQELHWLPVRQRIIFKILLLVFKFYHNSVPLYIAQLLEKSKKDNFTLIVPRAYTPYGDRAFSTYAPRLWNSLPHSLRASATLSSFRSHLKHHLFANFDIFISHANIFIE